MHRRIAVTVPIVLLAMFAIGGCQTSNQTKSGKAPNEEEIDIAGDFLGSVSPGFIKSHTFSVKQASKYDLKEIEFTIALWNKEQSRVVHEEIVKFGSWKSGETKTVELPLLRFKELRMDGSAITESGKKVKFETRFAFNIGEH